MKERIKKIWNDPVWSSVISTGIIGIISILWIAISSAIKQKDFTELFWNILNQKIPIKYLIYVIITILLIIVLIKIFITQKPKYTEDHQILDLKLFTKIRDEHLPANGSIAFLRKANFSGNPFSRNSLNDLEDISYHFNDPYLEFIDPELNEELDNLKEIIGSFLDELGENTWLVGNPSDGILAVPKEWQYEQYDRYRSVTKSLNHKADLICNIYDKIIRLGKIKFGV